MNGLDYVEIVFDKEDRQVAVFLVFKDGSVIEKHFRKLSPEKYMRLAEIQQKLCFNIPEFFKKVEKNKIYVYGYFEYVLAMVDAMEYIVFEKY